MKVITAVLLLRKQLWPASVLTNEGRVALR